VAHTRYDGTIHGFFCMPAVTDRSTAAIEQVAAAVGSSLG